MQPCWNCGKPGRIATRAWADALAGWWCDACGVGWGIRDEDAIKRAEHARAALFAHSAIGSSLNRPAALTLLTGIM